MLRFFLFIGGCRDGECTPRTIFEAGDVVESENGHVSLRFNDTFFQLYCGDEIILETASRSYSYANFKFDTDGSLAIMGSWDRRYRPDVVWKTPSFQDRFVGKPIMRVSNEGFIGIYDDSNLTTAMWKSESQCPGNIYGTANNCFCLISRFSIVVQMKKITSRF